MTKAELAYVKWLEIGEKIIGSLRIQQLTGAQDQQVVSWLSGKPVKPKMVEDK